MQDFVHQPQFEQLVTPGGLRMSMSSAGWGICEARVCSGRTRRNCGTHFSLQPNIPQKHCQGPCTNSRIASIVLAISYASIFVCWVYTK